MHKFMVKADGAELIYPVTPSSFKIQHGVKVETLNIHEVGDVNFAGYPTLNGITTECMFPAQYYPFCASYPMDPYQYIEQFKNWAEQKTVLRFIISDTLVNEQVKVESVEYGEQDGTGDLYATITYMGYRQLQAARTETQNTGTQRGQEQDTRQTSQSYQVKAGDCIWNICDRFYGTANMDLCNQLAAANGVKNPSLIYPGQVFQIPPREELG